MASIAPTATPTRTGVRIHTRCGIDRIFFLNHHRRPLYNHGPRNNNGPGNHDGSPLLDNDRSVLDNDRSGPVLVSVNFPLVT